jgi:hypothetical protein
MLAECISHQGCHNTQCDAEHTTVTMQWNSALQQVFLWRLEMFCGLHQFRTFFNIYAICGAGVSYSYRNSINSCITAAEPMRMDRMLSLSE